MTCDEARRLILEAEPAELAGEGGSPLAAHLRMCGACARRAAAVLRGQADLDRALGALGPGLGAGTAERMAVSARRTGRRWLLPAAGLAAAAALVAVALLDIDGPPPEGAAALPPVEDVPTHVELQLSPERPAMVLATRNPAITVVWYR